MVIHIDVHFIISHIKHIFNCKDLFIQLVSVEEII